MTVDVSAAARSLRAAIADRRLCASAAKCAAYEQEPFVGEGYAALFAHLGERTVPWLQEHVMVVFKPDLIAARRVERALDFVERSGFAVSWHGLVLLDRLTIETIWRFQWNVATFDRHALAEVVYCHSPSLALLLRDRQAPGPVPAAVRFGSLKGSPIEENRCGSHLRGVLAVPNRMMSMVHAPDEPIDVVRELAILFGRAERDRVCASWAGGGPVASLADDVRRLYGSTEASELDVEAAVRRLEAGADPNRLAEIRAWMHRCATAGADPDLLLSDVWRPTSALIRRHAPGLSDWDRLTIGAHLVVHEVPGRTCVVEDVDTSHWSSGPGMTVNPAVVGGVR